VGAAGYDPHYFPTLAAVEREHYWFATRREVVRDALRDARVRLEKLIEDLKERLGPLELGEPPDELLAALRRHVGLRGG